MICKQCNIQYDNDTKFCPNCGGPCQPDTLPTPAPAPVPTPAPAVTPNVNAQPTTAEWQPPVAPAPAPAYPNPAPTTQPYPNPSVAPQPAPAPNYPNAAAPAPTYGAPAYTPAPPAPKKQKGKGKGLTVALICLTAFFFVGAVVSTIFAIKNATDASYYRRNYWDVSSDYENLKKEYEFYHEYAVICDDMEDDPYYHTHECENFDRMDSYWIFNKKYAENKGYRPCPKCIQ